MNAGYRDKLKEFLLSKAGPRVKMSLGEDGENRLCTAIWNDFIGLSILPLAFVYSMVVFLFALAGCPGVAWFFALLGILGGIGFWHACVRRIEIVVKGEEGRWRRCGFWKGRWKSFRCAPATKVVPLWRPGSLSGGAVLQHVMVQNDGVSSVKIKFPGRVIPVEFGIVIVAFLEYSRLSGLDDLEAEERSVDCGDCEWLSGNVKPVPYSPWRISSRFAINLLTWGVCCLGMPYVIGRDWVKNDFRRSVLRILYEDGKDSDYLSLVDCPPSNIGLNYRWHKSWVKENFAELLRLKARLVQASENGDKEAEAQIRAELRRHRDELVDVWASWKNYPRELVATLACRLAEDYPHRDIPADSQLRKCWASGFYDFGRFSCVRNRNRITEAEYLARLSACSNSVDLIRVIQDLDPNDQTNELVQIAKRWSVLVDLTAKNPSNRRIMLVSANVDPSVLPRSWDGKSFVRFEFGALEGVDAAEFGGGAEAVTVYSGHCTSVGAYTLDKLSSIFHGKAYEFGENAYYLTPVGKVFPRGPSASK